MSAVSDTSPICYLILIETAFFTLGSHPDGIDRLTLLTQPWQR